MLLVVATVVWLGGDGYRDGDDRGLTFLDALYYATVSLSTTGYGDITPVTDSARLGSILLITPLRVAFLIVVVGTTVEVLTERTRDQLRQTRWRASLRDHAIVVGYGTKGRSAVRAMVDEGVDLDVVVVIDPDPHHVAEATEDGVAAVQGDGTRAEVLRRAHVDSAARVVVAVPRDDTAVLVTLTVRAANPTAHVVAAVREAENAPLLRQSGADGVVVSSEAAGRLLGVAATAPATGDVFEDLLQPGSGLDLTTRPVTPAEVGRGPGDCGDVVVAVVREARTLLFTAPEVAPLREGDTLVVLRANDH